MSFEDKQHVCSDCWVIATAAERERIIKLIESAGCDGEGAHYYCGPICDIDKLIALIKEGNK